MTDPRSGFGGGTRPGRGLAPALARALVSGAGVLVALAALALLRPAPLAAQEAGIQVDSVAVRGNERVSTLTILNVADLQSGSRYTYQDLQRAQKDLFATGQFRDVQVYADGDPDSEVVLIFEVEEWQLVRRLDIRGLENVGESAVRDTTGLRPGMPYSPQRVLDAKNFIRQELAAKGIPFARIDDRLEPIEGRPNEAVLVLDVTEGHRVTVAQIAFRGNETFSDGDLADAMGTSPEGFFWFRQGTFDAERLETDLRERLPAFYAARGFIDFSVQHDTLVVDPQTGKARLEITVSEGERYHLSDFTVEGNRVFPTDELERYFEARGQGLLERLGIRRAQEEGGLPAFDQEAFRQSTQRVQQRYRNEGYLYAEVVPFIERMEGEDGTSTVAVGWQISEGQPSYVNRVAIRGNEYTWDRVIRDKVFLLPGDVYSEDRLIQSWQNIQGLGFFETPMEPPNIEEVGDGSGDVNITFNVQEKQTGSVNFGTSVGGGTGLSGFIGYDQPNLFGQAKAGHFRWDYGRFINSFEVSFSDPMLFGSLVSGQISLFNSRDRFFTFRSGRRKRTGFSLRAGFPVPRWLDATGRTRVFTGYSLAHTTYDLREGVDDTSLFGRPPGTQSQLSLGITRSTLNHPLFPTAGSRQNINNQFNGGPLGGDGEFVKTTFDGSWWVPTGTLGGDGTPMSRGIQMALGFTFRGGSIFGNADRFPFDRFWMGGVQFGQQLRGYDETSITPEGYFPERSGSIRDINRIGDAFLSMTAEYRIKLSDQIAASLFYDAGNVWRDPQSVDPSRLFRGAGLGVQIVTPFGPIGLDYAYGFDKDVPGWQLHFRMGPGF